MPPTSTTRWTAADIPDLRGRRALVTGAAGGLGQATAEALAEHGAELILADINQTDGEALASFLANGVTQSIEFRQLDLSDLGHIQAFAEQLCGEDRPLDMLINIAGIYPPARRTTTADGFELKFGINHLGHFALTGRLLPVLLKSEAPRVVSISSIVQAMARIDFDDLQSEMKYQPNRVYAQAKLACLMFGIELQRRARTSGSHLQSMVAHPGIARTTIGKERKQQKRGLRDRAEDLAQAMAMRFFGQSPDHGAWPILFAATAEKAIGGGFYGPDGFAQFAGYPTRVKPCRTARDSSQRQRLWHASREMTGVDFSFKE